MDNARVQSAQLSVVVQGPVSELTKTCLSSVRRHFPDAELIVSTWKSADLTGIDCDVLVENDDPGSFPMSPGEISNVRRQIVSTREGIKASSREYVLKLRSDLLVLSDGCLKFVHAYPEVDERWHFLNRKIVIPSSLTRDPRYWESPVCPSDWSSLGNREDMLLLWDIPLPTPLEEVWFEGADRPVEVDYYYPELIARFNPEQFIWVSFLRKYRDVVTAHMFDKSQAAVDETLRSFANNLIVVSDRQFGIRDQKPARPGLDRWHVLTHKRFKEIHNMYGKGKNRRELVDLQQFSKVRFAGPSVARQYRLAKAHGGRGAMVAREVSFIWPLAGEVTARIMARVPRSIVSRADAFL